LFSPLSPSYSVIRERLLYHLLCFSVVVLTQLVRCLVSADRKISLRTMLRKLRLAQLPAPTALVRFHVGAAEALAAPRLCAQPTAAAGYTCRTLSLNSPVAPLASQRQVADL
jgi:hypothetical protein